MAGIGSAAGTIFFSYIGLDAVSTAGDEVKDPQRTMPRALIAALLTVSAVYILVTFAALGAQQWSDFGGQKAGLATILDNVTGTNYWGTVLAAGAVISICTGAADCVTGAVIANFFSPLFLPKI